MDMRMDGADIPLAHRVDADGESNLDLAGADLVGDHSDSHETARAEAINDLDRNALGKASRKGGTAGVVERVGRQNGADTNVADSRWVDVRVGDGCLVIGTWMRCGDAGGTYLP